MSGRCIKSPRRRLNKMPTAQTPNCSSAPPPATSVFNDVSLQGTGQPVDYYYYSPKDDPITEGAVFSSWNEVYQAVDEHSQKLGLSSWHATEKIGGTMGDGNLGIRMTFVCIRGQMGIGCPAMIQFEGYEEGGGIHLTSLNLHHIHPQSSVDHDEDSVVINNNTSRQSGEGEATSSGLWNQGHSSSGEREVNDDVDTTPTEGRITSSPTSGINQASGAQSVVVEVCRDILDTVNKVVSDQASLRKFTESINVKVSKMSDSVEQLCEIVANHMESTCPKIDPDSTPDKRQPPSKDRKSSPATLPSPSAPPPMQSTPTSKVQTTPTQPAPPTSMVQTTPTQPAPPTSKVQTPPTQPPPPTSNVQTPPTQQAPTSKVQTTPTQQAPTSKVETPPTQHALTSKVHTIQTQPPPPTSKVHTPPTEQAPTSKVQTPPTQPPPPTPTTIQPPSTQPPSLYEPAPPPSTSKSAGSSEDGEGTSSVDAATYLRSIDPGLKAIAQLNLHKRLNGNFRYSKFEALGISQSVTKGFASRLGNYELLFSFCDFLDPDSGIFVIPVNGRYRFEVTYKQLRHGKGRVYLARDDGKRHVIGRFPVDGDGDITAAVEWTCNQGSHVWVEAIRLSGGGVKLKWLKFKGEYFE